MHLFFSTPVWASKIENYETVNEQITNYIMDLKQKNPHGIIKSNFNGWHSNDFNLSEETPKNFTNSLKQNINIAIIDIHCTIEKKEEKTKRM